MIPFKRKTIVSAKGSFKKIAVNVEAQGIPLKKTGDSFKGDRIIEFDDGVIDIPATIKGLQGSDYHIAVTINDVTQNITGVLKDDGINRVLTQYRLVDFKRFVLIMLYIT